MPEESTKSVIAEATKTNAGSYRHKRRKIWFGAAIVTAAIATGGVLFFMHRNVGPLPAAVKKGIDFPLYYPANLPAGYSVDHTSFQRKGQVLIFSINAPSHKSIAVSEERVPSDLDLSQHPAGPSGITLPDEDNFTTAIGQAQISFWGPRLVCSLVTPNTWIILNVSGFTNHQSELVANSFRPL